MDISTSLFGITFVQQALTTEESWDVEVAQWTGSKSSSEGILKYEAFGPGHEPIGTIYFDLFHRCACNHYVVFFNIFHFLNMCF